MALAFGGEMYIGEIFVPIQFQQDGKSLLKEVLCHCLSFVYPSGGKYVLWNIWHCEDHRQRKSLARQSNLN